MHQDRSGLQLTLFAAALAIALFGWVELSLSSLDGQARSRPQARAVAPGLSIAVMQTDRDEANQDPVRNVAFNDGALIAR